MWHSWNVARLWHPARVVKCWQSKLVCSRADQGGSRAHYGNFLEASDRMEASASRCTGKTENAYLQHK